MFLFIIKFEYEKEPVEEESETKLDDDEEIKMPDDREVVEELL